MNRDEAKNILLLYRPGTADADDPQIAEALALAKRDPELARWLEEHCARQEALREKFRQIAVPAGLKEQIISEQAAQEKMIFWRRKFALVAAAAVMRAAGDRWRSFWFPHRGPEDTLAIYQNRMAGVALRGYAHGFDDERSGANPRLSRAKSRAGGLCFAGGAQKAALTGCAVEGWQDTKVSMICFRTGKPLPPGESKRLWLFVVDRASVKDAPPPGSPQLSNVNRLITAVWTQGDKLYLLGTEGDEQAIGNICDGIPTATIRECQFSMLMCSNTQLKSVRSSRRAGSEMGRLAASGDGRTDGVRLQPAMQRTWPSAKENAAAPL